VLIELFWPQTALNLRAKTLTDRFGATARSHVTYTTTTRGDRFVDLGETAPIERGVGELHESLAGTRRQ